MKKLLVPILLMCGCRMPGAKSGLLIINRSSHVVSVQTSRQYPDTAIQESPPFGRIFPNDTFSVIDKTNWADIANSSPGRKLIIFFFDDDTLHGYNWNKIRSAYKVLQRRELTADDIKRNQYSVVFE